MLGEQLGYIRFGSLSRSRLDVRKPILAAIDKAKNTTERAKGKVKEVVGEVSGDDSLQDQGKADQTKGNLKQAGEKAKDAFRR